MSMPWRLICPRRLACLWGGLGLCRVDPGSCALGFTWWWWAPCCTVLYSTTYTYFEKILRRSFQYSSMQHLTIKVCMVLPNCTDLNQPGRAGQRPSQPTFRLLGAAQQDFRSIKNILHLNKYGVLIWSLLCFDKNKQIEKGVFSFLRKN